MINSFFSKRSIIGALYDFSNILVGDKIDATKYIYFLNSKLLKINAFLAYISNSTSKGAFAIEFMSIILPSA